ncbi:hypothetical protein, partial [Pantoea ananatis]|uniref:hypothetical protein n=1 Tax=Pantoea ananas TaxID=553 RepID=UPI0023B0EE57
TAFLCGMMDKITMSILFSADRPLCAKSGRCLHHGMLVYREQVSASMQLTPHLMIFCISPFSNLKSDL